MRKFPTAGFRYAIKIGLACSALLVINMLLVRAYINATPFLHDDIRIVQIVQFLFPLVMILVQFWIYDYLRDYFDGRTAARRMVGRRADDAID